MIDLPATPGPVDVTWRQIDFGGTLTPGLGGTVQRINRNGNRFACSVTLPPMTPDQARAWVGALNAGVREGVRWRIRQVEFNIGAPGSPVVSGGGQSGSSLVMTGATARYAARVGQVFSLVSSGARYVHFLTATTALDASGAGTLAIAPPLRVEPANADVIEFGVPQIEGLIEGEGFAWTIDAARRVGLAFTIVETA